MQSFPLTFGLSLLVMSVLCFSGNSYPRSFDIDNGGLFEFEIHSDLQFDDHRSQDCSGASCGSKGEGWRLVDIDGRLKFYPDIHSAIFIDSDYDFSDESTAIARSFIPESNLNSDLKTDDDDNTQFVFGYRRRQSEFSIGKHKLKTSSFGPSGNNFLQFNLSGFDDDRIDWFSYEIEESFYALSSVSINRIGRCVYADSLDISGALGAGVDDSDDSKLSLGYDLLLETTILGFDNIVLSIAARTLTDSNSDRELESYGVKVTVFNSNGSEYTVGLSENDFGRYAEIAYSYIWLYRYRFTIGGTDFDTGSDGASLPNRAPISDTYFVFTSFTYAVSELIQLFGEYSQIDDDDIEIENVLVGLKMSF